MNIQTISPVETSVDSIIGGSKAEKSSTNFDKIIDSISQMESTQVNAKTELSDVLMGNSENSHGALIALQQAELQISFASSVRDKAVQGVNQLFNMQI